MSCSYFLIFLSLIFVPEAKTQFCNAAPLGHPVVPSGYAPNPKSRRASKAMSEEYGGMGGSSIFDF
jgi:hypothetical protein